MTGLLWVAVLLAFAAAVRVGRAMGLLPIVSQLLVASAGLPLAMWYLPVDWPALTAPAPVHACYSLAFALLLGQILGDVATLRIDRASLWIALPSFVVPFAIGLAFAPWLLPESTGLGRLALGLVFAITAIPVLYLYLQHLGFPSPVAGQLMQAAIVIDLVCWTLFGVTKGSLSPGSVMWPLLLALLPLGLYGLGVRRPQVYSLCLLVTLLIAEWLGLNPLLAGTGFALMLRQLRLPFVPLVPQRWLAPLQQHVAVPLLLAYGVLSLDLQVALNSLAAWQWAGLLLLPLFSKLLGNRLGLALSGTDCTALGNGGNGRWRAAILLNVRGLSEIVFLNLLLKAQLVSPGAWLALMFMGLVSTLLPALTGLGREPAPAYNDARRQSAEE